LNVCNASWANCGKCNKCIRTLLTLDALGCLDDFQVVFDLVEYRKNKENFLKYHFMMYLKKDLVHREIQARSQFSFFTTAFCLACLHFQFRQMKRHGGKSGRKDYGAKWLRDDGQFVSVDGGF
jgi:hypothetical protein